MHYKTVKDTPYNDLELRDSLCWVAGSIKLYGEESWQQIE